MMLLKWIITKLWAFLKKVGKRRFGALSSCNIHYLPLRGFMKDPEG